MIRAQTKRIIRSLYAFRCGYCGVSETQCGAELTYDHFCPQSHNGSDDAANLVYACHACNEFKGDYWSEDERTRLLHPLADDLTQHLREAPTGEIQPLTSLGSLFIDRLQLNRATLVENRLERRRLQRVEERLAEMTDLLQEILGEVKAKQAKP